MFTPEDALRRFSLEVRAATTVAVRAGQKIMSRAFMTTEMGDGVEKGDPNVGHHAIVNENDVGSQEFILHSLHRKFPGARFITEEKAGKEQELLVITNLQELSISMTPCMFIVDPLDGSSMNNNGLYEWSVSIGAVRVGLEHVGGAIFAPGVLGGVLVFGERDKGVFLGEGKEIVPVRVAVTQNPRSKSVVYVGPDVFFLMDHFGPFVAAFSKEVRTTNCTGSCALGLALVAAGKIDALVQPVQCPWDWAAGYPLIEEAGGKMIFYRYQGGSPVQINPREMKNYSSTERNAAFIAGSSEIVDWLWDLLQAKWVA